MRPTMKWAVLTVVGLALLVGMWHWPPLIGAVIVVAASVLDEMTEPRWG